MFPEIITIIINNEYFLNNNTNTNSILAPFKTLQTIKIMMNKYANISNNNN